MKILVVAEPDAKKFSIINQHTLSAASQLGEQIDLLFIDQPNENILQTAQKNSAIKKILVTTSNCYAHALAENVAPLIAKIATQYDYVLMAANTTGKNILPRVAALIDVAIIGDVVQIISADSFVRPIYAGNALQTVKLNEKIKLLTIRATAFPLLKNNEQKDLALIEKINDEFQHPAAAFISEQHTISTRPELTDARIIVSGGRGLKNAENFQLIEKLADCLGAAVGASRAAVDAGFAPNDWQVGQTGKIVAPELYIAIGISGAIQHLAGMKDSKIIVAINSDPDAPIFAIADYYLVGDLFNILPELQNAFTQHTH